MMYLGERKNMVGQLGLNSTELKGTRPGFSKKTGNANSPIKSMRFIFSLACQAEVPEMLQRASVAVSLGAKMPGPVCLEHPGI